MGTDEESTSKGEVAADKNATTPAPADEALAAPAEDKRDAKLDGMSLNVAVQLN